MQKSNGCGHGCSIGSSYENSGSSLPSKELTNSLGGTDYMPAAGTGRDDPYFLLQGNQHALDIYNYKT